VQHRRIRRAPRLGVPERFWPHVPGSA
jgi:hypothetical protein